MAEPQRLYLHLGLQKTGTSYLQGVMQHNAARLAGRELDLVPETRRDAFELMLLVRQRYNPERDRASTATALHRFSVALRRADAPAALLSQESLAAARPAQVERLLEACGDREVHVVLTVRDLGRQLASSWQQELKSGRTDDYPGWLARLQDAHRRGSGGHPWIQLDPPAVLRRWAVHLPPERLHVVTVPPSGSPPTELLRRYCAVLGVDPGSLVPQERPANTSLGRVQAELLRRVNVALPEDLRRRQVYGDVGKRYLASQVLADQPGERILVPAEHRAWAEEVAREQVTALEEAGYRVEGTLDDLRPLPSAFAEHDSAPGDRELVEAAVTALVRVVALRAAGRGRGAPGPGHRSWRRRLLRVVRRPGVRPDQERDQDTDED